MELKLIEKILFQIFKKTFEKMYKKGLSDAFNFISAPIPPQW